MYDSNFISAYLEIIAFLLKEKTWKTTTEIRKLLERKNILTGTYDNNRRKTLKYLENLEYAGYIERKEGKGKRGTKWKIKNNTSLKDLITLNEKEKNALLLSLSFIPSLYKDLEFLKEIKSILKKANVEISENKEKLINNAFLYIPNFIEKSFKMDFENIEKIVNDILNENVIRIHYKNKNRKILPLKIIFYEGLLYLLAIENPDSPEPKARVYRLGCLRRFISTKEKGDAVKFQNKVSFPFNFEEEKLFPFAIEVHKYYIKCDTEKENLKDYRIVQTQYHLELLENGNLKIYLLGYPSQRFYSHLSMIDIIKIYKPDEDILQALIKNFDKNYEYLKNLIDEDKLIEIKNIDLNLAIKRFSIFKTKFKNFLERKIKVLE